MKKKLAITVPSSKSIANRVLILAALSKGKTVLKGDFEAEDIQLMIKALQKLGIPIVQKKNQLEIFNDLSWREKPSKLTLNIGNSGTCMRFLTVLVVLRKGKTILNGKLRMKERPIKPLVDALRQLGVRIRYLEHEGYPPIEVFGTGKILKSKVTIRGDVSSQFISALLLSGPAFEKGLELTIQGKLISAPYIETTISLIKKWESSCHCEEGCIPHLLRGLDRRSNPVSIIFTARDCFSLLSASFAMTNRIFGQFVQDDKMIKDFVEPQCFRGDRDFEIEGDASAAVYFWTLGFLHNVDIEMTNLPKNSVQADARFPELLKKLKNFHGRSLTIDMKDMPDASLMLMALGAVLSFKLTITGIGSLRVKETDRIHAMATELKKLGVSVSTGKDWMKIVPLDLSSYDSSQEISIDTYDDHRIAMSFAILGTKLGNLEIRNSNCVKKTYPKFWEDLGRIFFHSDQVKPKA